MTKFEYTMHITFWVYWFICSLAMAIVMVDGMVMAFTGLPPFLGSFEIWLANHILIFFVMWIILTTGKAIKLFMF